MSIHGRSLGRRGGLTLAAVAVAAAVVLVVIVIRAQVSAPAPHAAGRIDVPASSHGASGHRSHGRSATAQSGPVPLPPSPPTTVRIPAIGVSTPVYPIGLAPDGTLAVPQPGPHLNNAAWFENSPTPGQPGPSIIEGHVDSTEGPSVFFKLGAIKPGDRIFVTRRDGRTLTFEVNAVRDFLKSKFPTTLVYGQQQANVPTLRLITCSNFDPSIEHHIGNEVVFAHLSHATQAHNHPVGP